MRVPIITRGTRGVDMKVNPLTLGTTKLRSATNLVFEEGGIRTRPSFKYTSLGIKGQFQGAAEYNLAEGISSGKFGEGTGMALVVDGKVSVNCEVVGDLYSCKGDVDIFDAENYIIFQNRKSDTYWWDGDNLVKSTGMIEQHWDDPQPDFDEVDLTPPVADIPNCDTDAKESKIEVRFLVIDYDTREPIPDVLWDVRRHTNRAYHGLGGDDGRFLFNPIPRTYTYNIRKTGYYPEEDKVLVVNGVGEEVEFDPCAEPYVVVTGELDVLVVLHKLPPELLCSANLSDTVIDLYEGFDPNDYNPALVNEAEFTVQNNGENEITISTLDFFGATISSVSPSLPITLDPDETQVFTLVHSSGDFFSGALSVTTGVGTCTFPIPSAVEYDVGCGALPTSVTFDWIQNFDYAPELDCSGSYEQALTWTPPDGDSSESSAFENFFVPVPYGGDCEDVGDWTFTATVNCVDGVWVGNVGSVDVGGQTYAVSNVVFS